MTRKFWNVSLALACLAGSPAAFAEDATVTFGLGSADAIATLVPEAVTVEAGQDVTIPANLTIYSEGKTLTGWTDGTNTYAIGSTFAPAASVELTPVFTDNSVSLADRTEPVTLRWDFQRQNGAPSTGGIQGKDGLVWVTQATINGQTIDVALPFSTVGGKFANANWNDWAQLNSGTTFQVPSCKGAVITFESFSATTTTTIDGQVIDQGVKTPSFECFTATDPVAMVIGDGSYFRYIQVTLPVVASKPAGGETFTNAEASVVWAFNSDSYADDITATPENGFSMKAFDQGVCTYKGTATTTACPDVTFVQFGSKNGASDMVSWNVKPAKGLTFTPTSVSFYIARNGTDGSGDDVTVQAALMDGSQSATFGTITPHRNNKTQADDKFGKRDNYTTHYEYTLTAAQQQALTSGEGFSLKLNNGYGNTKGCMYSDVRINGLLNGTTEEVEMYTLTIAANPAEGGTVTAYPAVEEYEAGTEVKLTAANNFGYSFINWTDAAGNEVSAAPEFIYTMNAAAELTANFQHLNTYELSLAVEGGANIYQIEAVPAGTMINGKRMYEEGTIVTLTAISNPIVSFANWADGQTSSEIKITMDGDKSCVANFDAVDYVAGWDFMLSGGNGRVADFAAADNDAAALNLRNAAGEIQGWLDKSEQAAGGYEGRPAAVNWRTTGLGDFYWQTKVNAEAFTDIKVITAMALNYNAYSKQNVEYSLDGENWTKVGTITIPGTKNWIDGTFALPAAANNQKDLYIRWISDKSSDVIGTSSSNDGIALGASYIIGTAQLVDDGTAPVLLSTVPEEGSNTASINGKIVLSFDEKVKVKDGVKATLGDLQLTPSVTGKTVMFEYKNLNYGTDYTFRLPAASVTDLTDNAMAQAITINFTTKTRPAVTKALYDVVVTTTDELAQAIAEANNRSDKSKRFRIFIHNGEYKLPTHATNTKTGSDNVVYADPTTYITAPNISFIGESRDGVIITNTVPASGGGANPLEGIGKGDVLRLEKTATNCYFQHLTIKSAMGDAKGRDIEVNDNSDKTIMKDVCLYGCQDTYVSNNDKGRFYFEGGVLRGRTDYLCGKGDVFYNAVTLKMVGTGGYLTAPSVPKKYGYVFRDCEIVGDKDGASGETPDGKYTLGRPWGSGTPIAVYINTKMTVRPSAVGWNEMSGGWPARFAEYNSTTATGTVIDLKDRKTTFGDGHTNNPSLTKAEADALTLATVMGGDDDWDPASHAEQAPAPCNVRIDNGLITWDDCEYASHWAICENGRVVAFTTEPSYEVASRAAVVYSVRAANEMGGLGEAVEASAATAIIDLGADAAETEAVYYNLQGIRVANPSAGIYIREQNGKATKVIIR